MASGDSDGTEPVVALDRVCFSWGDQEVLHDVSFAVPARSFVGIVGPNGGGKTTLLRLLLGLQAPARGSISVFGRAPVSARGRIGYVMQQMQYDERFPATTRDIALMGRAGKRPLGPYTAADRGAADEALARVAMDGYARRPFAELSGGQRQRVLIASALAGAPEMLLLDEPTAGIDSDGEAAVHELLRSLAETVTILMVSHNINTVLDCSDLVLCINRTATLNPLANMQPEIIARARGGGIAVLHHELNCRVFDRGSGGACDGHAQAHRGYA